MIDNKMPTKPIISRLNPRSKCIAITEDSTGGKKIRADFLINHGQDKSPTSFLVRFGANGYSDFTIHKDEKRKQMYLSRHRKNENWNDPFTAGALSRWLLWNKKTLNDSFHDFVKKFKLTRCIDPYYWGAATWNLLHAFARDNKNSKREINDFVLIVSQVIPCVKCRKHFKAAIDKEVSNRKRNKSKMVCCNERDVSRMHNTVNKQIGKPQVPFETALDIPRVYRKSDVKLLLRLFEWNIHRDRFQKSNNWQSRKNAFEKFKVIVAKI